MNSLKNLFLIRHLIALRSSYWFIPMLMVAASMGLAAGVVQLDSYYHFPESLFFNWISNIGPGGARAVFATIAGSTITVAGTIFSIAMVVLVMASNQFGPRLIPTFMRVGKIQFGIGLFIGTFVYCLILLTFVPAENKGELLPVWGVLTGVVLGISAFLVLIMLIHEIATFIQAPVVAHRVSQDMINTFERVFPEKTRDSNDPAHDDSEGSPTIESADARPLSSLGRGYLIRIDYAAIVDAAAEGGCLVHFKVKPGDYVITGQTLAMIDQHAALDEAFVESIHKDIELDHDRNLTQDPQYAVDQMVEIAVRALSPGINDPFTAINCIDKIGSALGYLTDRRKAVRFWRDDSDVVRVVARPETWEEIVDAGFNQIRHHGAELPPVLMRLMDSIGRLAELELDPDLSRALYRQLLTIGAACDNDFKHEDDRVRLQQRFEEVRSMFELEEHATARA